MLRTGTNLQILVSVAVLAVLPARASESPADIYSRFEQVEQLGTSPEPAPHQVVEVPSVVNETEASPAADDSESPAISAKSDKSFDREEREPASAETPPNDEVNSENDRI